MLFALLSNVFIHIYLNQYYCLDINSYIGRLPAISLSNIYDMSTSVLHFKIKDYRPYENLVAIQNNDNIIK